MGKIRLRIIHETNPLKYYPAIYRLEEEGVIDIIGEYRYSVVKEWFRSAVRDRKPLMVRTIDSLKDLGLRLRIPFIQNETIILGFAPWDWRILIFWPLVYKNRIIYHTSWPFWQIDKTPNQYGLLNRWLKKIWLWFLKHPHVEIVALTNAVSQSLKKEIGNASVVIPHSVPTIFFESKKDNFRYSINPLKIIYVGELSAKKGINKLLDLAKNLDKAHVVFTIVGDGPLRKKCEEATNEYENIQFEGAVYNKTKLATLMSSHDILLLLSQRTKDWEELFGIVIIEALAAGLGIIATNHIGPTGIFSGRDCDNLFQENDLSGIRQLLIELSEDFEKLEQFKKSQVDIAEQYHINSVTEKWFELLNNNFFYHV